MTNADVAQKLREHAGTLTRSGANLYRVRAFRQAAVAVLAAEREAADVIAEAGPGGLQREFGIGESVADTIAAFLASGEWRPRTAALKA
jgi:DNA polymerase (family 10)